MIASELDSRISALENDIKELFTEAKNDESRKRILDVVQKAQRDHEPPVDVIWRMFMSVSQLGLDFA